MANALLSAAIRFARRGLYIALPVVALGVGLCAAYASRDHAPASPSIDARESAMRDDVSMVAAWLMRYKVNRGQPFIIADKVAGMLYAFDNKGKLLGLSPALFGAAQSDALTPAQAAKRIEDTLESDKVTPAGVFAAEGYRSPSYGQSVWFTGYKHTNLLIHRAFNADRVKRLQTSSTVDNRMTYGCINALPEFVDNVLVPYFSGKSTVVILPETQPAKTYFAIDNTDGAGRSFMDSFLRLIDAHRPRMESGPRNPNRLRLDPDDAPGEVAVSSARNR